MAFVDFAAVKEAVSFADTLSYLALGLKQAGNQWRGPCPTCNSGGDRALVVTDGKGWFCFALKKGGDQISLAAHIMDMPVKDAAQFLAEKAGMVQVPSTSTRKVQDKTVPESEGAAGSKLSPLSYLEHEHDMIVALGLDPAWCEANGVGYAPRGVVRGSIAIPFRDKHGALLGYFGVQDLMYVPPDFTSNVVPFKKTA